MANNDVDSILSKLGVSYDDLLTKLLQYKKKEECAANDDSPLKSTDEHSTTETATVNTEEIKPKEETPTIINIKNVSQDSDTTFDEKINEQIGTSNENKQIGEEVQSEKQNDEKSSEKINNEEIVELMDLSNEQELNKNDDLQTKVNLQTGFVKIENNATLIERKRRNSSTIIEDEIPKKRMKEIDKCNSLIVNEKEDCLNIVEKVKEKDCDFSNIISKIRIEKVESLADASTSLNLKQQPETCGSTIKESVIISEEVIIKEEPSTSFEESELMLTVDDSLTNETDQQKQDIINDAHKLNENSLLNGQKSVSTNLIERKERCIDRLFKRMKQAEDQLIEKVEANKEKENIPGGKSIEKINVSSNDSNLQNLSLTEKSKDSLILTTTVQNNFNEPNKKVKPKNLKLNRIIKKWKGYKKARSYIPRKNCCEYYRNSLYKKVRYKYEKKENVANEDVKNEEEVRNKILEQLTLLRKKKITNFVESPPSKSTSFFASSSDISLTNVCKKIGEVGVEVGFISSPTKEEIKRDEAIKPTKTNDVTKIKGWKNKRFLTGFVTPHNSNNPSELKVKEEVKKVMRKEDAVALQSNSKKETTQSVGAQEKVAVENSSNSAFSSSILDGFLESPDLNISYEIPTLTTEKRKEPLNDIELPVVLVPKIQERVEKVEKPKLVKKFKARTVAEIKKLESMEASGEHVLVKKLQQFDGIASENDPKDSYLYFTDKKLIVRTRSGKDVFARTSLNFKKSHQQQYQQQKAKLKAKKEYIYVPYYKRRSSEFKHFKPSIFNSAQIEKDLNKAIKRLNYKPGPLSKKFKLQESECKEWSSEVVALPKVYLDVYANLGKPIHPNFHHIVENNSFNVTRNQVELAVSALPSNEHREDEDEETQTCISFEVPYQNNQTKMLIRRKIYKPNSSPPALTPQDSLPSINEGEKEELSTEDTIKDIVNKMINYVEVSEEADALILEDPDLIVNINKMEDEKLLPEKRKDKNLNLNGRVEILSKKQRRSKTCMELKRLNVKVIEVDIEEDKQNKPCLKQECVLGCICNSLNNLSNDEEKHCGQPKCMFSCSCSNFGANKNTPKVSLPAGTDLLSVGTLNRLQDEAKKDLAKVEKEFTQTVIQAKNKTIVVAGSNERSRRITKAPKKYEDFIESTEVLDFIPTIDESINNQQEDPFKAYRNECKVKLVKLDLSDLVPLCLIHNKYDCKCNIDDFVNKSKMKYKFEEEVVEIKDDEGDEDDVDGSEEEYKEYRRMHVKRTQNTGGNTYDKETYCARTKGLATNYYFVRNKTPLFKDKLRKKCGLLKWAPSSFSQENTNMFIDICESNPINSVNNAIIKQDRRKQLLKIRNDEMEVIPNYEMGSQLSSTVCKMLGRNADCKLMPWRVLIEKYKLGSHSIWYVPRTNKPKLYMTEALTVVPPAFLNIKSFIKNNKVNNNFQLDIMKWILTDTVPNDGKILVILTRIKIDMWEICGTVENKSAQSHHQHQTNTASLLLPNPSAIASSLPLLLPKPAPVSDVSTFVETKHVPLPIQPKIIPKRDRKKNEVWYFKTKFTEKTLVCNGKHIKAELPGIAKCHRWVMLEINESMVFMKLANTNFEMKLVDFRKLLAMAKTNDQTIVVHLSNPSKLNKDYGVYAVPNADIVFIGPYSNSEKSDVQVRIKLDLEVMKNKSKLDGAPWAYQVNEPTTVIDLTDEPEELIQKPVKKRDYKSLLKSMKEATAQLSTILEKTNEVTKPPKFGRNLVIKPIIRGQDIQSPKKTASNESSRASINVIPLSKLKEGESTSNLTIQSLLANSTGTSKILADTTITVINDDDSRYLVTNIPCLGYIQGTVLPQGKFQINWPGNEKKQIEFNNESEASHWFKDKVEKGLHIIPKSLKLCVKVVKSLNLQNSVPFDHRWLLGSFIVGKFGVINYLTSSTATLKSLDMSAEDLNEVLQKKMKRTLIVNAINCYELFMPRADAKKEHRNLDKLVSMLQKEIDKLKVQEYENRSLLKRLQSSGVAYKSYLDKLKKETYTSRKTSTKKPIPRLQSLLKKTPVENLSPRPLNNSASTLSKNILYKPVRTKQVDMGEVVKTEINGQVIHLEVMTSNQKATKNLT